MPNLPFNAISLKDCAALMGLIPPMVVYRAQSDQYSKDQAGLVRGLQSYLTHGPTGPNCPYERVVTSQEVISASADGSELTWFAFRRIRDLEDAADKAFLRRIHAMFPASRSSGTLFLMDVA